MGFYPNHEGLSFPAFYFFNILAYQIKSIGLIAMNNKLKLIGALPLYVFLLFHKFPGMEEIKIPSLIILVILFVYRAKWVFGRNHYS